MRLSLNILVALMLVSCARPPESVLERFPIGMFGVRHASEVDSIAKEGFDTFLIDGVDAETQNSIVARAIHKGMRIIASPVQFRKSDRTPKDGPLDAWLVHDGSDDIGLSSKALAAEISAVKSWGPNVPATFFIGAGANAKKYAGIGDAMMLGWYPVPYHPIGSIADEIDKAYWYTGGRPLWVVVQSFDYRDLPQRKPIFGRFPDHLELRSMSYLAIVHGAKGLFYYTLNRGGGKSLLDSPELWQATARMAREMRAMQPIFSANRRVPLPFEPSPGGVEAACWRWRGRNYVVLVNRHIDRQLKVPAHLLDWSWRPLFEIRRDPKDLLKEFRGAYYLPPLRVLVLESPIQWRDLFGMSRTSPPA